MSVPLPPVVVLCGGLGTRLQSVVADRPKVLADVAGRPFLAHLLTHLAAAGAHEVVLSAGHMADQIADFAAREAPGGLTARVVVEEQPLGTAGALRFAADAAGLPATFLALNGDTFFSGSLGRLHDEHVRRHDAVTIALVHVGDAGRYGAVRIDQDTGDVLSFDEKGGSDAGWINAGAYAIALEALATVATGEPTSLETGILPGLVGRGLGAVPFPNATFLDIGTPADYARAESILASPTER